ncbi:MAG: hypothetical protein MUO63_22625, partial [Desulfobulbaceae bacterium]|nr:hypothetical protein [Desulfobulbaceae bacterium]
AITLKVKYHDFITVSRSMTLTQPTNDSRQLYQAVLSLLPRTLAGAKPVRLVGIAVDKLQENSLPKQLDLFGSKKTSRKELNRAIDQINIRFGSHTIKPATLTGEPSEP